MKFEWDFTELTDFADRITNVEQFDKYIGKAAQNIAKKLHSMLIDETPIDFGTLVEGWRTSDNYTYMIEKTTNGFEVTLINKVLYALWVNDGHKQQPGRFIPGYWEGNHFRYDPNADGGMRLKEPWVWGRFFVERSILMLENMTTIEKIVEKQITQWFGWCVNGK